MDMSLKLNLSYQATRQTEQVDEKPVVRPIEVSDDAKKGGGDEDAVTANEDLMREHGVLRRILIAYREVAPKLVANAAAVDGSALAAATTGSVAFEGKLAAEFKPVSAEGPTTLTYYKASCKQSARPECVIAYLWCDSPQDIGFEINGVADAVLGKWLVKDGAKATMSSGKHLLALQPTEMIMDDLVGGWDLKFNAISAEGGEDAQSWFVGLDPVPKITISTGKGDDVLPIDGDNGKQLSLFLAACRTVGK